MQTVGGELANSRRRPSIGQLAREEPGECGRLLGEPSPNRKGLRQLKTQAQPFAVESPAAGLAGSRGSRRRRQATVGPPPQGPSRERPGEGNPIESNLLIANHLQGLRPIRAKLIV